MNMIDSNRIVQSFWFGGKITKMELLCMNSFINNGHEFHLYSFQNIEGLPEEIILKDANEILPKELLFTDSYNLVAAFSDWFRYKLLHDRGGWWVDMDVICLKHFNFEEEYCFASERNTMGSGKDGIATAVFKAPSKSEFLVEILEYIDQVINMKRNIIWGEFGPPLLSEILKDYDSSSYVQNPDVFCPLNWYDTENFVLSGGFSAPNESFCIHLWNRLWGKHNLNKDADYPSGSPYEVYKRKYEV